MICNRCVYKKIRCAREYGSLVGTQSSLIKARTIRPHLDELRSILIETCNGKNLLNVTTLAHEKLTL